MRIQTGVIAIFGASGTGKTTLATGISSAVGGVQRGCGAAARERAHALGIGVKELSPDQHRQIDVETLDFLSRSAGVVVVEGRHLHYVLADFTEQERLAYRVELVGSSIERANRLSGRSGRVISVSDVLRDDQGDLVHQQRLFPGVRPLSPTFTFDTSGLTPSEALALLLARITADP